jgi:hypothetical protein
MLGVTFAVVCMELTGALLCGVGALVPMILFGFAPAMVALHRTGVREALGRCMRATLRRPLEHITYNLAFAATAVPALGLFPIGPGFLLALHVRAYRAAFGDGDVPDG